ncbi:MAG TPA: ATPase domain-containing protein [Candidatus Bilamarchaeum sp.]|nr:ATPase domain-containing protein [Candidatus Bilamarchaeum sp.]
MKIVSFPSLDPVLNGGFPEGDQILLSGPPGSGKSILAMQYIHEGIKKGENGVFFTLDSEREFLINQMKGAGIDAESLIAGGKMDVVELDPHDVYVLLDEMEKHVKRLDAKRLVLDSLSILFVYCGSYKNLPEDLIAFLEKTKYQPPITMGNSIKKQMLYTIMTRIRHFGCTSILISELSKNSKWFSRDTISEFACDGILLLDYHILGAAGVTRTISIVKMRRSDYKEGVHEFKITGKGILIQPE